MEEMEQVEYIQIPLNDGHFNYESLKQLKTLLTIHEEGNSIYLCSAEHLLNNFVKDDDTEIITKINWNSFDVGQMLQKHDFANYSITDQLCHFKNNQFIYLYRKGLHKIEKYRALQKKNLNYHFGILEQAGEEFLVRGIVCCNQNGFNMAFNPNALNQESEVNSWQKKINFSANY